MNRLLTFRQQLPVLQVHISYPRLLVVLTIHGNAKGLCTGITRRDLLSAGSLGVGGVSLDHLLRLDSLQAKGLALNAGKAKSCIVLFLYGAWSQLDTLDMKPAAPREVRGEFQPISTSLPGIQISEHLPRLAADCTG